MKREGGERERREGERERGEEEGGEKIVTQSLQATRLKF